MLVKVQKAYSIKNILRGEKEGPEHPSQTPPYRKVWWWRRAVGSFENGDLGEEKPPPQPAGRSDRAMDPPN